MKKNLFELDQEKAALVIKYDKSMRDYEKMAEKLTDAEKRKKDLEDSISTFKASLARQKQETDTIMATLQGDQAALARQVELQQAKEADLQENHDRQCKALVNKLNALEDEHANCK